MRSQQTVAVTVWERNTVDGFPSEAIFQLQPIGSAILQDRILEMLTGRRITIVIVEQVIHLGGEFPAWQQLLGKEGHIRQEHTLRTVPGECEPTAHIASFQTGKHLVAKQWNDQIPLDEMLRGIRE